MTKCAPMKLILSPLFQVHNAFVHIEIFFYISDCGSPLKCLMFLHDLTPPVSVYSPCFHTPMINTHTSTHPHQLTPTHTHPHPPTPTHTHPSTHSHLLTHTHPHPPTPTHIHPHSSIYSFTPTHPHSLTPTHIHPPTHPHI